jgi:hypothetical protein
MDGTIGGIARSIELIRLDDLAIRRRVPLVIQTAA